MYFIELNRYNGTNKINNKCIIQQTKRRKINIFYCTDLKGFKQMMCRQTNIYIYIQACKYECIYTFICIYIYILNIYIIILLYLLFALFRVYLSLVWQYLLIYYSLLYLFTYLFIYLFIYLFCFVLFLQAGRLQERLVGVRHGHGSRRAFRKTLRGG